MLTLQPQEATDDLVSSETQAEAHQTHDSPGRSGPAAATGDTARQAETLEAEQLSSPATSLASPRCGESTQAKALSDAGSSAMLEQSLNLNGCQEPTSAPPTAAAANVPNGAWVGSSNGETESAPPKIVLLENDPEKKLPQPVTTQMQAVSERDRQVFEMSQRAKKDAQDTLPQPGLLSQALAYIMAKVTSFDLRC